jgi:hypothetical protein
MSLDHCKCTVHSVNFILWWCDCNSGLLAHSTLQHALCWHTDRLAAHCNPHAPVLLLQAVPYSFSIATVKRYIWKRSDDVIFHYRILDAARVAPFPQLGIEATRV